MPSMLPPPRAAEPPAPAPDILRAHLARRAHEQLARDFDRNPAGVVEPGDFEGYFGVQRLARERAREIEN